MQVRRVVTGNDGTGRSRVVSDGPAGTPDLWRTSPEVPLGDPGIPLATSIEPVAGGSRWGVFEIRPNAEAMAADPQAGFHTTATVDYVTVLQGRLTLVLDDGEVALGPGDCVVQRNTAHAWRNDGPETAVIMAVLVGSPPS
jgi:hypothetical protein